MSTAPSIADVLSDSLRTWWAVEGRSLSSTWLGWAADAEVQAAMENLVQYGRLDLSGLTNVFGQPKTALINLAVAAVIPEPYREVVGLALATLAAREGVQRRQNASSWSVVGGIGLMTAGVVVIIQAMRHDR